MRNHIAVRKPHPTESAEIYTGCGNPRCYKLCCAVCTLICARRCACCLCDYPVGRLPSRAQQKEGRLPSRAMFATMTGGEVRRPGGQPETWHRCLQKWKTSGCFEPQRGPRNIGRWCLELRPRYGPLQQRRRASGIGGFWKQLGGSWLGGIRMKRMRVENAMHPLWVVPKGMGRGG